MLKVVRGAELAELMPRDNVNNMVVLLLQLGSTVYRMILALILDLYIILLPIHLDNKSTWHREMHSINDFRLRAVGQEEHGRHNIYTPRRLRKPCSHQDAASPLFQCFLQILSPSPDR